MLVDIRVAPALAAVLTAAVACAGGDDTPVYLVRISFVESVSMEARAEVQAILDEYGDASELVLEGPVQPIGTATVKGDRADLCNVIQTALRTRSDITNVECELLGDE
jgi:hypothetical protein